MKILYFCLSCMAWNFFMPYSLLAHGVLGRVSPQKAMMVEASYDDGEPMAYAGVEIYGPAGKIPFQSGRSDQKGRFLFLPDREGLWKAVVNDGMGHRLVLKTRFNSELVLIEQEGRRAAFGNSSSLSRLQGVATGISLIFGVFGVFALCKVRHMLRFKKCNAHPPN